MQPERRLKAAMVVPVDRGGYLWLALNLCEALAENGADMTLVTSRSCKELPAHESGFRIMAVLGGMEPERPKLLRGVSYGATMLGLRAYLRRGGFDIVHFQDSIVPHVDAAFFMLRGSGRPKAVLTSHDPDQDAITATRRSLLRRKALAGVYRGVDGIIVMSDSARDELVSAFDVPASKVARIAHGNYRSYGADRAPSKADARQRLGLTAEGKLVLFFGSLKPSKGLECLLRAFARVREAEPTARLLVAGEPRGVEVPALEALAESLHLGESAILRPGYVPSEAVPDYLAAADLVALPYLRIFQSGVLHLAYSFGRPVVATRVGALAEDVQDGKSGLLVPPGDEEALADAILELLGSPERLATIGAYATELSQTVYDWKAIARQTLDFYESLLVRGRAA